MHGEISQKDKAIAFILGITVGLIILSVVLFQLPAVQNRIGWRVDFAMTFLRGVIDPVRPLPTAAPVTPEAVASTGGQGVPAIKPSATTLPTESPTATAEVVATALPTFTPAPTFTPTPIPQQVELAVPKYEKQELNNCGPATLAMHLRFYNWAGDQKTISDVIKPLKEDRNVNVEELASYVHTKVPGFDIQYRVGGDIEMLKRLIAAGFPVTVEEAFIMAESYWFNDDRWAGHYLLLTGYNDATQRFTAQDVFLGPNISVPYSVLDKNWKAFNRVYILAYPIEQQEAVKVLLGEHWDVDVNRQHAMEAAQKETEADSTDSYAWFNYGTNLVYFEKYAQAAQAYDEARNAGLPQRMLRYQFGPFFAYFNVNRTEDLLALTEYALKRTPNSEEALLWRGWGLYRQGNREDAYNSFLKAMEARPDYSDAVYALNFLRDN
jgi:tetratricopeptide (TPR) repeat protein